MAPKRPDNAVTVDPPGAEPGDLANLKLLAKLMDNAFQIPGLKMRFGLDSILGLFPGIGDLATSVVSLYILQEAHRRGVSRATLGRMGFNVMIDWLIGSIPLAGDAFDVYWKSNDRNVKLLLKQETAQEKKKQTTADWAFLVGIIIILLMVLIGSMVVSYFIISYVARWFVAPG